ncbi:unnamed protein product [Rangifer tarandus platyrhynchus]|uniref:Uncharacterized protein n=2 Tax=Rangifer tarandus platyrhynchus TaxID=3082113 RepID=A0ABN8YWD2_RANTA|nr:unnamed protein product [Rangifer tarandus platyrhynchus]
MSSSTYVLHATWVSFPGGSEGKESACNAGDPGLIPGSGRSPGGGPGTHSSALAWGIPWTEEPGGVQFMGSQSWARLSDFTFTSVGRSEGPSGGSRGRAKRPNRTPAPTGLFYSLTIGPTLPKGKVLSFISRVLRVASGQRDLLG